MVQERFALLIVDSIMAPFRADYTGRGELAERQQVLGKLLSRLQKISEEFNVAVFLSNQVMAEPDATTTQAAAGGNILAQASTTRLYLRKESKKEERVCKMYASSSIPEGGECIFQISDGGIMDGGDSTE